jgi:hypothetical protein
MEKEFIPYEQALALKELGLDESCFGYYLCKNSAFGVELELTTNWIDLLPYDSSSCKAPLYQQAFRWFREKYNMNILIILTKSYWFFNITWDGIIENFKEFESEEKYSSYEEAELECLKKLIQIVKDDK